MKSINLGIIDLGFRSDSNAVSSVEDILEYAVQADNNGFSKFWLAEHHYNHVKNHPYTNPEILMTIIAGMTEQIQVGSAGTSINLYSPYAIASNYKLMNNLFYNRISLGLSKGFPESNYISSLVNKELTKEKNFEFFNKNLETIHDLLHNEEENLENKKILIPPFGGLRPDMWYLSTSYRNFTDAVKYKLNYCVSVFHNFGQDINNMDFDKTELLQFKELFYKVNGFYPKVALSLAVLIKDSIEEAKQDLEKLFNFSKESSNEAFIMLPTTIDLLEEQLLRWQEQFGIDEFVLYDVASTNTEKLKNLQLISEKFNLLTLA